MKRLVIVGSRTILNRQAVYAILDEINWNVVSGVFSGGAQGVDTLVEKYCKKYNIPFKAIPAKWGKYGKKAGYIRNRQLTSLADEVIVFWDCKSRGTAHQFALCEEYHKKLTIHKYDKSSRTFNTQLKENRNKEVVTLDDF